MGMLFSYLKDLWKRWVELAIFSLDVIGYIIFVVFEVGKDGATIPAFLYWDWIYIVLGLMLVLVANFQLYKDQNQQILNLSREIGKLTDRKSNLHLSFFSDGVMSTEYELFVSSIGSFDLDSLLEEKSQAAWDAYRTQVRLNEESERLGGVSAVLQLFNTLKNNDEFSREVSKYIDELAEYFTEQRLIDVAENRLRTIHLALKNKGSAIAKSVKVVLTIPENLMLIDEEFYESMIDLARQLEFFRKGMPEAPNPRREYPDIHNLNAAALIANLPQLNQFNSPFQRATSKPLIKIRGQRVEFTPNDLVQGDTDLDIEPLRLIIDDEIESTELEIQCELFAEDMIQFPVQSVLRVKIVNG
jgi:hypothetical protein